MSELTKNINSSESNYIKNNNIQNKYNNNEDLYEDKDEIEKQNYLNNPETFRRKRDYFSFYSKYRNSAPIPHSNEKSHFNSKKFTNEVIPEEKPESPVRKKFPMEQLKPRGFGIYKVKEKIEFFERNIVENEFKNNNMIYKRNFDMGSIKIENSTVNSFNLGIISNKQNKENKNNKNNKFDFNIEKIENIIINDNDSDKKHVIKYNIEHNINLNFEKKEKKDKIEKNSDKKLNLNLVVDYSKLINSSKVNKEQKEFDIFIKPKKDKKISGNKKKNKNENENKEDIKEKKKLDLSLSLSSFKEGENSTNFTQAKNQEKLSPKPRHRKQNSGICCYNDLITKISEPKKNQIMSPKLKKVVKVFQSVEKIKEVKNNKYMLVKNKNNRMSVEKNIKYTNKDIKKVICDSISDKMALDRYDQAKHKLNQNNNNKIIENQIFEILDKIIIDNHNLLLKKQKEKHLGENNKNNKRKKIKKAIEIKPQLLLVKQKVNILQMNNPNLEVINDNNLYDENNIKKYISSQYFLECIGLEPKLLFNDKENNQDKNIINDINEKFVLNGINNKKKYLKYYFRNLSKANAFLEILIDHINKLQINENISLKK